MAAPDFSPDPDVHVVIQIASYICKANGMQNSI